jgi:hypothetical protein
MYTMNTAFQEVAITSYKGTPKGILPAAGQNNILLCIIIIVIICLYSGGDVLGTVHGRGRRRRGGTGLLFALFLLVALGGTGGGGRNLNTNLINVTTDPVGTDDVIDL